jgi:hypothetical protein
MNKSIVTKLRHIGLSFLIAFTLTGCGNSEEELDDAHTEGYEAGDADGYYDGYYDGQYDVCREVERIAPAIEQRLRSC